MVQIQCNSTPRSYICIHAADHYHKQLVANLHADALGSPGLRSQQLPLQQDSSPALVLTSKGLFATGAAFDSAASQTALAALEQQPPVSQQAQELRAAFLQVCMVVSTQLLSICAPSANWG